MIPQVDRTEIAQRVAALQPEQLALLHLYLLFLETGDPVLGALAAAPAAATPVPGEEAAEPGHTLPGGPAPSVCGGNGPAPHARRVLLDWTIEAWADLELLEPPVKDRILRGARRFAATGQGHLFRLPDGWQLELGGHRLLLRYDAGRHRLQVVAVTRAPAPGRVRPRQPSQVS